MDFKSCLLSNISICAISGEDNFNLLLYNPLAQSASEYVQIPVKDGTWEVTGPNGENLENTLTNPITNFDFIAENLTEELLPKILFFKAENIPPVGYNIYNLKRTSSRSKEQVTRNVKTLEQIGVGDNYVNFDEIGRLKSMTIKNNTISVSQELMYYFSDKDISNPWIFRSNSAQREAVEFTAVPESTFHTSEGNLIREVKQKFSDWATQIIRIYADTDYIEFDYVIGPIDIS